MRGFVETPIEGNPVKDGRYALSKTGLVSGSNKRARRLRRRIRAAN